MPWQAKLGAARATAYTVGGSFPVVFAQVSGLQRGLGRTGSPSDAGGRRQVTPCEDTVVAWHDRGMGGRVVEGSGLENRRTCKRTVGSNPTPSEP